MLKVISMKKVITIVEDEKDLNELVKRYLEREGYEVRSYLTYDEASQHTNDDDVHLWILDIMLGDKSGFDLIEEIRQNDSQVPVIFMSARDKEFDRIIGLEKGSDDYITKPFSPKELVLRVNNLIRRVYREEDTKISIDGYEIDETQRMVFHDKEKIDLTTKEFDLLMLFVNNRGTAFPREAILSKVWEANYFGSDRVVDYGCVSYPYCNKYYVLSLCLLRYLWDFCFSLLLLQLIVSLKRKSLNSCMLHKVQSLTISMNILVKKKLHMDWMILSFS